MKRPTVRLPSTNLPPDDPDGMDSDPVLVQFNRTNWQDEGEVITLARKLGPGNCVVKYATRPNYNIVRLAEMMEIVDHKNVRLIHVVPSLQ